MSVLGDNFRYPHSCGVIYRTIPLSVILNSYSYWGFGTHVAKYTGKEQRIQGAAGRRLAVNKNKQQH